MTIAAIVQHQQSPQNTSMQPSLPALSRYLSWALDRDAVAEAVSPLSGGVHRNLRVRAQVERVPMDFVVRLMPPKANEGFARREVLPYDLEREFSVLSMLQPTDLSTPEIWGLDLRGRFLGTPSFVMEFIHGPTVLEAVKVNPGPVLQSFLNAIMAMNRVAPEQLPGIPVPEQDPAAMLGWLREHSAQMELPAGFGHALDQLDVLPSNWPMPAFGNGDLNPLNFIYSPGRGTTTIIDWEYAGFNNPLTELMLLHVWPEDEPFLDTYPLDEMYCRRMGVDRDTRRWHELFSALSGWIYAARDNRHGAKRLHEGRLGKLTL